MERINLVAESWLGEEDGFGIPWCQWPQPQILIWLSLSLSPFGIVAVVAIVGLLCAGSLFGSVACIQASLKPNQEAILKNLYGKKEHCTQNEGGGSCFHIQIRDLNYTVLYTSSIYGV